MSGKTFTCKPNPAMRVGITGQSGFLGSHLVRAVESAPDMELVPFEKHFFGDHDRLCKFVSSCDAVLHFAGASRMPDEDALYATNMGLVTKLIEAMEHAGVAPHVLFASSTHESRPTAYGRAKREGREKLAEWARRNGAAFTGLVIPNVYGPGAKVHYCSFIANFAWELQHDEEPRIQVDAPIPLIYVDNLLRIVMDRIRNPAGIVKLDIPCDFEKKVSEILQTFRSFASNGPYAGEDPNLRNLSDTFFAYR